MEMFFSLLLSLSSAFSLCWVHSRASRLICPTQCVCVCASVYSIKYVFLCYPEEVQPACLPTFDQQFRQGTKCWTSGFGVTEPDSRKQPPTVVY